MIMNLINTIVALCIAGITLPVITPVLRDHSPFRFSYGMAVLVCALVFLALKDLGSGWMTGTLLGYGALGVTIAILAMLALVHRLIGKK